MKNAAKLLFLALTFSTPLAMAQMAPTMSGKPGGMMGQGRMDEAKVKKMQEQMLKMHAMMHRIEDAKTPQERQKLMAEQRHMMMEHMKMMRNMQSDMGGGQMQNMPGAMQHTR